MIPWVRPFSLPVEPASEQVFDTIASAHGTSLVTWLIDTHPDAIRAMSSGLIEYLREWTQMRATLDTVWDLAFGRAHLMLKEGRLDVGDVAARVGMRIAERGPEGKWTAMLRPSPIAVGPFLVQDVTGIDTEVTASGEMRVTLRCEDGRVDTFRRNPAGVWAGEERCRLRSVGAARGFALLARDALPDDVGSRAALGSCQPVEAVDNSMQAVFGDGLALLDRLMPHYVPWVTRVVHGVVVCAIEEPFHLVSGSWEDIPGFIHVSSPHVPVDIAEILVHEAAHQYFYMLERVGPLDDGTDTTLYWSPPIRMKRPLSRILMAFHALVNVLQLYRAVRASGGEETAYVVANEPALCEAIEALNAPLQGNPALTRLGRSLYEPLAELLPAPVH